MNYSFFVFPLSIQVPEVAAECNCISRYSGRALLLLPPLQHLLYDTRVQHIRSIDFESSAERFDCICTL